MRTRALWRLDEVKPEQRPIDAIGAVADLSPVPIKFGSAAAVNAAIGFGVWTAGYHFNGNGTQAFGPVALTSIGAPTFAFPGPRGVLDLTASFPGTGDGLSAGDNYDPLAVDFALASVVRFGSAANSDIIGKGWATSGFVYVFETSGGTNYLTIYCTDGVHTVQNPVSGVLLDTWYACILLLDRTAQVSKIAYAPLSTAIATVSPSLSIATVGSMNSAGAFTVGALSAYGQNAGMHMDQLYVATGANAASFSANLATATSNFARAVMSSTDVVDAAAGRGRSLVALSRHGFENADLVSGSTLLTRDASVQALVRWDVQEQGASTLWTIKKTGGGANADDAGIASVQTIAGDGYVEFSVDASSGSGRCIGLSTSISAAFSQIDFMLAIEGPTNTNVWQSGSNVAAGPTFVVGDRFRIERVGTTVLYKKNGVTFYTSLLVSTGALMIDTRLFVLNSELNGIRLVDAGTPKAITWQALANITPTPTEGVAGTLYARGKATGTAEYLNAGVELRVANASQGVGELRWLWQTSAGTLKRQAGGYFAPPTDGSFVLLTATRRWVSSTQVILRYFLGDRMLSEVESVDGDIGGGTTGTTTIGSRFDGTAWGDFFDGVIDELRVVDYELTPEEIEATWKRISVLQPRGYRAVRDLFPPDAPISDSPSSRIQRLMNLAGQALGYAAAQVENLRNLLPDRAYGDALAQWEGVVAEPPKALDSVDTRRARVLGHLRQRAGFSLDGMKAAISGLVATPTSNLEVLTFAQEFVEGYDKAELYSYDTFRTASSGAWTPTAGLLSIVGPAAPAVFDSTQRNWITADLPISHSSIFKIQTFQLGATPGVGLSAHLLSKIAPTTLPSKAELGIAFHDWGRNHAILIGLRNNAGTYQIVTEQFTAGVSQGVVVRATTALQAHWLHLYQDGPCTSAITSRSGRTAAASGTSPPPGRRRARAPVSRATRRWSTRRSFTGRRCTTGRSTSAVQRRRRRRRSPTSTTRGSGRRSVIARSTSTRTEIRRSQERPISTARTTCCRV
jgi:hypothetical protein